ncbi:MAG: beta-lactamase family protein [Candidatus Cloacimonetes bacterium]|nr:beta-lactamase family protein [Candidatus Cloacimonadota bacterium]
MTQIINVSTELTNKLQSVIDNQLKKQNLKGLSVAIRQSDEIIWKGVSGISYDSVQIDDNMLFGIASITKTFTTAIILQLEDEKRLSLNDKINKWLPPFPNIDNTITISQLLAHTSGVYNYLNNPDLDSIVLKHNPDKLFTPEELILKFVNKPNYKPGEIFEYNNTDFILLGMIIEKVTKNSISEEYENRIFRPLKLKHTFFYPYQKLNYEIAHPWHNSNQNDKLSDFYINIKTFPMIWSFIWTAGGIFSTVEDLSNWGYNLFCGNILSETALKKMITPIKLLSSMGLGIGIDKDNFNGKTCYGHAGGYFYSSDLVYIPANKVTICVLANSLTENIRSISSELFKVFKT